MTTRVGTAARVRLRVGRAFDGAILLSALLALILFGVSTLVPRLKADAKPDALSPDGGYAFTFGPGLNTHWPYAVPSHPDFDLAPGSAR